MSCDKVARSLSGPSTSSASPVSPCTAATQQFGIDLGCVKTLRGITAPGILGSTVTRRVKKRKNLSSARHYDQIRFRFHTAKTQQRHECRIELC